jgi:hypothetical protein
MVMTDMTQDTVDPFVFTETQKTYIRFFCWYPARGLSNNLFNSHLFFEWFEVLQYRMLNLSQADGAFVANDILAQLILMRTEIPAARQNMSVDASGSTILRKEEMEQRIGEYSRMRLELCDFFGINPGPLYGNGANALYTV